MQRLGPNGERTPLMQPSYMFENRLSRDYQKRLRNLQCAVCASIMVFLAVCLLVIVTYNLGDDVDPNTGVNASTSPAPVVTLMPPTPAVNLTLLEATIAPLINGSNFQMNKTMPIKDKS